MFVASRSVDRLKCKRRTKGEKEIKESECNQFIIMNCEFFFFKKNKHKIKSKMTFLLLALFVRETICLCSSAADVFACANATTAGCGGIGASCIWTGSACTCQYSCPGNGATSTNVNDYQCTTGSCCDTTNCLFRNYYHYYYFQLFVYFICQNKFPIVNLSTFLEPSAYVCAQTGTSSPTCDKGTVFCDGVSAACPHSSAGTMCRASTGECDAPGLTVLFCFVVRFTHN